MTADDIRKKFKHLGEPEPAITYGRLVDVDPETGCATLDVYQDDRIPLRFDDSMKSEALRLNGKSVKVKGHGWMMIMTIASPSSSRSWNTRRQSRLTWTSFSTTPIPSSLTRIRSPSCK